MKILKYILLFLLILFNTDFTFANTSASFNLFIWRGGGDALSAANDDAEELSRYDIVILNKFHYDDDPEAEANTWANIKTDNADCEIYLYQVAPYSWSTHDAYARSVSNTIDRWESAGPIGYVHTSGSLHIDNHAMLLTNNGTHIALNTGSSANLYMIDFSHADADDYVIEAYELDFEGEAWATDADGIYSDLVFAGWTNCDCASPRPTQANLDTDAEWNTEMTSFLSDVTAGIHAFTPAMKFGGNRGLTREAHGKAGWASLDAAATPMDFVMEEAAFLYLGYGANNGQFFPPTQWLSQIETFAATDNSDILLFGATDLTKGENGTDQYGEAFTYWDAFWYFMGSYLLIKEDHVFIYYTPDESDSNEIDDIWHDEYTYIDIGDPDGAYYTKSVDGAAVYVRKYSSGYVIVNPSLTDLTDVNYADDLDITETCREVTHANMATAFGDLNITTEFATLTSHRAKILFTGRLAYSVFPSDGDTGVSITASATWDYADAIDDADIWLDKDDCDNVACDGVLVSDDDADKTYDMSTLDESSTYCLGIRVNEGASQGDCQECEFTTSGIPPPDPPGLNVVYLKGGGSIVWLKGGGTM